MLPRIMVNEAAVYTTDIAYNIRLDENFDAPSVAFCFYNSLTMTLCEFQGRFYGGGVGELVPSEFKSLSMPYKKVSRNDFELLDTMFRRNCSFEDIVDFVDKIVLNELSSQDVAKLKSIRNKYLLRRLKTKRNE
ncbi:hypothetical protein BLX06_15745 [Bacillus cereus]|uniref:Type II methyltransferase M.Eco57I C-terminal domain-containing protein n=1 Tax=Bacillus cereus TaxID=1396 RepID=A0A9X6B827_BACCE|nr:hypothetical protein [Bacillus cereus]OOR74121.1 hypothetical protein BLX06_15745 [Bacillus cereus]